jgi:hypothetical protein
MFIVTSCYIVCHSSLYFINVATLTVAINSSDQALITVSKTQCKYHLNHYK